jgi:hypothetical protein
MNRLWLSSLVLAASIVPVLGGRASAEGWKMPTWNPFKKKDSHPAHLRIHDEDSQGSWWWKPRSASQKPSSQPSTWSKVVGGTRSAWNKTKDALNPFDDKPQHSRSVTGSNSVFAPASTRKPEKKKSTWWPSWNGKEEKKPLTVTDWIGLDRPE